MAVDLKQPISLKAGAKNKKTVYPAKTTINLVSADAARGNLVLQLALFLIVLVLVGIFAKFAVVDPLASALNSNSQVGAAQARLDELTAANANYAELNQKYARYVVTGLTEEELNLADRDLVLDLLEQKVVHVGYLSSLKVVGNIATVTCLGVPLDQVSSLVESLETDERVSHVTVSTAQGENDSGTSATIQITFEGTVDAADEAAAGDDAEAVADAAGSLMEAEVAK